MSRLCHFCIALLSVAALVCCVDSTSAAAFKRVHAGEQAPSFSLPDLDGNPVSLADYQEGPLTIVTFWALWSPKSEPLLQDIQKLLDEFGSRGIEMNAVAVNADGENTPADFIEQVKGLIERNRLQFPVVIDQAMEEYARWGVIAAPSTAFLGKDLTVVYEFSGHPTSAYQDMRQQVMKALGLEEEEEVAAKPKRKRYEAERRVLLNFGLSKTLFERGQFSKANRKLQRVLKDDPAFPDAHALHGLIQLGLALEGDSEALRKARDAFVEAVELDGSVPMGLMGLAHFALEDDDLGKALELARKAVQYTDDEVLGQSKVGEEPLAEEEAPPAPETTEGEVEEIAAGDGGATRLERAAAALEAGDVAGAKTLLGEYVDSYLAIPAGPKMSKKGLRMKMKLQQSE